MESFHIAANAVMPFVVYIAFGYLIQRIGIVDETTWDKLNRLVFYCFFPFLTFNSVYSNAVSTFTMSAAMGADGELASHYVMISTVISGFTLFLWIFFMKSVGLI